MANEISLVTASGRTVTPKDDGIIYEVFSPGNGIIYGGAVTIKDSSTLHITAGHGIVCGRKFTIDDSDIPVALSGSGSLLGRLYIHLDLADAADPITLLVETGESLTPVVQDSDVNINNGVFEINLATFDVDTATISNLVTMDVSVKPMGDMEGATAGADGKGGYVPAPQAGDEDKVLKGDGTWGTAGDTASTRYNNGYLQYTPDNGTTWINFAKVPTSAQILPKMTSNNSGGVVVTSQLYYDGPLSDNDAYKTVADSGTIADYGRLGSATDYIQLKFSQSTFIKEFSVMAANETGSANTPLRFDYTENGSTWINGTEYILPQTTNYAKYSQVVNKQVMGIRLYKSTNAGNVCFYDIEAWAS